MCTGHEQLLYLLIPGHLFQRKYQQRLLLVQVHQRQHHRLHPNPNHQSRYRRLHCLHFLDSMDIREWYDCIALPPIHQAFRPDLYPRPMAR